MDTTANEERLQQMANEEHMKELRAAVDGANEEAKQAIEDGTLVPELPPEAQEPTDETKPTEHVAVVGGAEKPATIMDPAMEKQRYRNDVLSFMNLSYVSLSARRKSIADNLKALEENKKYMDEVRKAVNEGNATVNDEIIAMNLGQNHDFMDKYAGLMAEGAVLTRIIDEITKRFPDEKRKSVSFVSDSMVQSCKAQIAALKEKYPDGSRNLDIKRLENIAEAYACRQDAGPLMNKLSYGHNMINHIKRLRDMDPQKVLDELSDFADIFKDKNLANFRQLLTRLRMETITEHKDEERTVQLVAVTSLFIAHWLAHSYQREYKDGRCTYFKTFVMNVYDYYSQDMDFDIPGGREVFKLTAQIIFACFEVAMALVSEAKSFKVAVKEYNTAYVKLGAAYTAQTAQFIGDSDTVKTATLVSDFLTEEDADQIADAVYGWLHPLEEEETDHDVDSDPEEGGVQEPAEEDRTEASERGTNAADDAGDNPAKATADETPEKEDSEGSAQSDGAVSDSGQAQGPDDSASAVQLSSGGRYTSAVSHRNHGQRGDAGSVDAPVGLPGDAESAGHRDPVGAPGEPGVPVEVAKTASTEVQHQLPISDGPEEDLYETVQEELAKGDDTPTSAPKRGNIN